MRLIGLFKEETRAREFSDFLYVRGIKNKIELEEPDSWEIWVYSEDHLESAQDFFNQYLANPGSEKFSISKTRGEQLKKEEENELKEYRKRMMDTSKIFKNRIGLVTGILIGISLLVTLIGLFGKNDNFLSYLYITRIFNGGYFRGLPDIIHGEVWRLVTPIFIHFNILHIFFNLWWLKDLGSVIEKKEGSLYFIILVMIIAIVSNLAQYFFSSPYFGGMSGVVYGLLGYIWIRGKYDPLSGYYVDKQTLIFMLGWLVLCFIGFIPNIANYAIWPG